MSSSSNRLLPDQNSSTSLATLDEVQPLVDRILSTLSSCPGDTAKAPTWAAINPKPKDPPPPQTRESLRRGNIAPSARCQATDSEAVLIKRETSILAVTNSKPQDALPPQPQEKLLYGSTPPFTQSQATNSFLTVLASSALTTLASETNKDPINRLEEESKKKDAEMRELRQAMDDIAKREETWRNKAKRLEGNKKDQSGHHAESRNMAVPIVKVEDPDPEALSPRKTIDVEVIAHTLQAIGTSLESLMEDFDATTWITIPEAAVGNELEVLIRIMYQQGPDVDTFEQLGQDVLDFDSGVMLRSLCVSALSAWVFVSDSAAPPGDKFLSWYKQKKTMLTTCNLIISCDPEVKSIEDKELFDLIIPETAATFAARFSRISETLLPPNHLFSSTWRHDLSNIFEAALRFKASSVIVHRIFEFMNFPPGTSHDRGDLVGEEAIDADQLWRLAELRIDPQDIGSSADSRTEDPIQSKSYFLIMERFSSTGTPVSSRESSLSVLSQTPELDSEAGDVNPSTSINFNNDILEEDNEELLFENRVMAKRNHKTNQKNSIQGRKISPFYCKTCFMGFESESNHRQHEKKNACPFCHKCKRYYFSKKGLLQHHSKFHGIKTPDRLRDEGIFPCLHCGTKYTYAHNLRRHQKKDCKHAPPHAESSNRENSNSLHESSDEQPKHDHTRIEGAEAGEAGCKSPLCISIESDDDIIENHNGNGDGSATKHGDEHGETNDELGLKIHFANNTNLFPVTDSCPRCHDCGKYCLSKQGLSVHRSRIHGIKVPKEPSNYPCLHCGTEYQFWKSLTRHQKNCVKPPICNDPSALQISNKSHESSIQQLENDGTCIGGGKTGKANCSPPNSRLPTTTHCSDVDTYQDRGEYSDGSVTGNEDEYEDEQHHQDDSESHTVTGQPTPECFHVIFHFRLWI